MNRTDVLAALLLSAALVLAVGSLTNELDIHRFAWDHNFYIQMAENGFARNDALLAHYAYRPLAPLIVRAISATTGLDTVTGFTLVAYVGAASQLFCVVWFCRALGFRLAHSLIIMTAVAFSFHNLKFLLFDVCRPDHLAFPLLIVAALALWQRRVLLLLTVTVVGLQTREFLIIPAAVYLMQTCVAAWRERAPRNLWPAAAAAIVLAAAVVVPRWLIPVVGSVQLVDPWGNPRWLTNLIDTPLNTRRNLNIAFVTAAYFFPLTLLATSARVRTVMEATRPVRGALVAYTAAVLLFTLYGGTDLARFVAYLVVPQIVLLGQVLRLGVRPVETAYMLAATLVFNRIPWDVPMSDLDAYLDFCGGYGGRINATTYWRIAEHAAYLCGALLLRLGICPIAGSVAGPQRPRETGTPE
jgi:hypothetical protein